MNEERFKKDCYSILNNYKGDYKENLNEHDIDTLGELVISEIQYLEKLKSTKPIVKSLSYNTRDTEDDIVFKLTYNFKDFKDRVERDNPELSEELLNQFTEEVVQTFRMEQADSVMDDIGEYINNVVSTVVDPEIVMAYMEDLEDDEDDTTDDETYDEDDE